MADYFKPWRRKIGALTLLMACVFAVGWVRSFRLCDFVSISKNSQFITIHGGIYWERNTTPFRLRWCHDASDARLSSDAYQKWNAEWQWRGGGFAYGETEVTSPFDDSKVIHIHYGVIPYWSIVIPLTLLSVWLFLGKTRVAKPLDGVVGRTNADKINDI